MLNGDNSTLFTELLESNIRGYVQKVWYELLAYSSPLCYGSIQVAWCLKRAEFSKISFSCESL